MKSAVTLVYPYFLPDGDNSIFRFPPLGLGYIAAYLKANDVGAEIIDCTFLSKEKALERIRKAGSKIIGIYSMFSMTEKAKDLARLVRDDCELLVAGGPQPTLNPTEFLEVFDVVVIGEGEQTMLELQRAVEGKGDLSGIRGIAYRDGSCIKYTEKREPVTELDGIPMPSRELFDNNGYKEQYTKKFGYSITSLITSRGCPFKCDFCSQPVFGNTFRARSAKNIVDEMQSIIALGYDRIWFADDCLTLNRDRILEICREITERGTEIEWECLSRVDTVDREVVENMKRAGCVSIFFGIESGNDSVLELMNKRITTAKAREAIHAVKQANIRAGAFFIIGYPGESDETVLDTVRFATSLPLDYLSFTLPYPIPGTPLYERVKDDVILAGWEEHASKSMLRHKLLFRSRFSETKLKFAIVKAMAQHKLRRQFGERVEIIVKPLGFITDVVFRLMR